MHATLAWHLMPFMQAGGKKGTHLMTLWMRSRLLINSG